MLPESPPSCITKALGARQNQNFATNDRHTKMSRRIILASVSGLLIAYISILLGVLLHEVAGHGLAALLLGGTVDKIEIGWDGMGLAYTSLPPDTTPFAHVFHLGNGVMVTTVVGAIIFLLALRRQSHPLLQFCLLITATCVMLDGLPYLLFNSIWVRPPGDFARILLTWQANDLPAPGFLRWLFIILGALGTAAATYAGIRYMYRAIASYVFQGHPPTHRQCVVILVTFFLLPSIPLAYLFDWNQLISGVGYTPNHISFLMGIACITAVYASPPRIPKQDSNHRVGN